MQPPGGACATRHQGGAFPSHVRGEPRPLGLLASAPPQPPAAVTTRPHTVQCDTTRCGVSGVGHVAKRPLLSLSTCLNSIG